MSVEAAKFKTNDGVSISFEKRGSGKNIAIFLHGWSGSRYHFEKNIEAFSEVYTTYRLDHRFHGYSDKPSWGHFVCRLAADVHDLVQQLNLKDVAMIGVSMGCSVIWAYCMLYGTSNIKAAIFIDQSPLQNKRGDWNLGSKGCYDEESLIAFQEKLKNLSSRDVATPIITQALAKPIDPDYLETMVKLTASLSGDDLGRLMADHTQIDWRPVLPTINIPCLNFAAGKSNVFPVEGVETVSNLIPNCKSVLFPEADHLLQIDEAEEFNRTAIEFLSDVFK